MAESQETSPCPDPSSVGEWCFRIRYLSQSAVCINSVWYCDTLLKKIIFTFPFPPALVLQYVAVNLADVGCRFLCGKPYFHGYLFHHRNHYGRGRWKISVEGEIDYLVRKSDLKGSCKVAWELGPRRRGKKRSIRLGK